jgi:hypothetical protein
MSKFYTVRIPVKKYLEKFINSTEGTIISSQREKQSLIWLFIKPYLDYKGDDGLNTSERIKFIHKLHGEIKIELPMSMVKIYGIQIPDASIVFINRMLISYFSKYLYLQVMSQVTQGIRYKGVNKALYEFCDKHRIVTDDDITTDALIKQFHREQLRNHKKSQYRH